MRHAARSSTAARLVAAGSSAGAASPTLSFCLRWFGSQRSTVACSPPSPRAAQSAGAAPPAATHRSRVVGHSSSLQSQTPAVPSSQPASPAPPLTSTSSFLRGPATNGCIPALDLFIPHHSPATPPSPDNNAETQRITGDLVRLTYRSGSTDHAAVFLSRLAYEATTSSAPQPQSAAGTPAGEKSPDVKSPADAPRSDGSPRTAPAKLSEAPDAQQSNSTVIRVVRSGRGTASVRLRPLHVAALVALLRATPKSPDVASQQQQQPAHGDAADVAAAAIASPSPFLRGSAGRSLLPGLSSLTTATAVAPQPSLPVFGVHPVSLVDQDCLFDLVASPIFMQRAVPSGLGAAEENGPVSGGADGDGLQSTVVASPEPAFCLGGIALHGAVWQQGFLACEEWAALPPPSGDTPAGGDEPAAAAAEHGQRPPLDSQETSAASSGIVVHQNDASAGALPVPTAPRRPALCIGVGRPWDLVLLETFLDAALTTMLSAPPATGL